MESLRAYITGVIAVAIICTLAHKLIGDKGANTGILKLITGLTMTLAVISPLTDLSIPGMKGFTNEYAHEAQLAIEEGKQITNEALSQVIIHQTEAYILDKAATLGAELSVKITVTHEDLPKPHSITIRGAISPYARNVLQSTIESDLGISRENQKWI